MRLSQFRMHPGDDPIRPVGFHSIVARMGAPTAFSTRSERDARWNRAGESDFDAPEISRAEGDAPLRNGLELDDAKQIA